jgi:DNA helicase-2/ATP-dependent DNA helicase PcrA
VLRWALNPRSRLAAQRVALLLPGLGPASVRRLLASLEGAADPVAVVQAFRPPPAAAAAWADCMAMLASLRSDDWPAAVGRAAAWYRPHLERLHEDAAVRWSDLLTLERLASAQPSMERFVTELTLDPPEATSDEAGPPHRDDDYLILSTMHSAKGQEWTAVYLLNVVDGCIPSDMATGRADEIEEERRLLHVAMTRARRHLALVMPQRFHVTQQRSLGDLHLYAGPSRFIPPTLAGHFDLLSATVGGPSAVGASGAAAHASASDALLASSPPAALDPALPPLARRVRSIF